MKIGGTGISGEGNVKGVQANLSAPDTPTSRDDEADRTRRCVPTRENFSPRATTLNLVCLLPAPERAEWLLQKTSRPAAAPDAVVRTRGRRLRWTDRLEWFRLALSNFTAKRPYSCFPLPFVSPRYSRVDFRFGFRASRRLRDSLEKENVVQFSLRSSRFRLDRRYKSTCNRISGTKPPLSGYRDRISARAE